MTCFVFSKRPFIKEYLFLAMALFRQLAACKDKAFPVENLKIVSIPKFGAIEATIEDYEKRGI